MGAQSKILVRAATDRIAARLHKDGHTIVEVLGEWLDLGGDAKASASELSKSLRTTVVDWSIHTTSETICIAAFTNGKSVRELTYTEGTWGLRGRSLSFENRDVLKEWLAAKRISANPDGYEILSAFLGVNRGQSPDGEILQPNEGSDARPWLPTGDEPSARDGRPPPTKVARLNASRGGSAF